MTDQPNRCACGQTPKVVAYRLGEDCMETLVECACGARGPTYEHWRADYENAVWAWNCGDRERTPGEPPHD